MTCTASRPTVGIGDLMPRLRWWAGVVQGADVVVAQRVEHELDLFAGCGDGADVLAAPVGDLLL